MNDLFFVFAAPDGTANDENVEETIVYQRTKRKDAIDILLPVKLRLIRSDIDNIMVYADDLKPEWKGTWIKSIRDGDGNSKRYCTWEQIVRGGSLIIEDGEDDQCYTLNIDNFTSGLLLLLRSMLAKGRFSPVFFDGQMLRVEAKKIRYEEWDRLMQYALFGDVLYDI